MLLISYLQLDFIELSSDREYLRQTLFRTIFGEALVFQNRDDMLLLRAYYAREGAIVPALYSLDGYSISVDGLVEIMPSQLEYVFGQQNVLESARYKAAIKGTEVALMLWI